MKPFYRHLVYDSWKISTKHYFLWPLAFLSSLVGVAGTFQVFFDLSTASKTGNTLSAFFSETDLLTSIFFGWSRSFDQIAWSQLTISEFPIIIFFFILLGIILAVAIITVSSQGGLIYALNKIQAKKQTTFLVAFRHGLDKFWHLFIVTFIYRLFYLLIIGMIILPLALIVLEADPAGRLVLGLLVYMVLVPTMIILDLVARYSIIYIILRENTISESIKNAWLLFRTNWIISIETAVLILFAMLISFLILSSIILPILSILFTFFGALVSFSTPALQLATVITLTTIIIVVGFFVTLFTSFQTSIWIGIFNRLNSKQKIHSKTHRLTRHLPWLHSHVS